jgi:hypothetical protein
MNRFQGSNSASLCSLAGRCDNPIPIRFLAPIDCSKIPALVIKPVCRDSFEIYHCLLLISFGKSRFKSSHHWRSAVLSKVTNDFLGAFEHLEEPLTTIRTLAFVVFIHLEISVYAVQSVQGVIIVKTLKTPPPPTFPLVCGQGGVDLHSSFF